MKTHPSKIGIHTQRSRMHIRITFVFSVCTNTRKNLRIHTWNSRWVSGCILDMFLKRAYITCDLARKSKKHVFSRKLSRRQVWYAQKYRESRTCQAYDFSPDGLLTQNARILGAKLFFEQKVSQNPFWHAWVLSVNHVQSACIQIQQRVFLLIFQETRFEKTLVICVQFWFRALREHLNTRKKNCILKKNNFVWYASRCKIGMHSIQSWFTWVFECKKGILDDVIFICFKNIRK